jgi:hypothetical protein
MSMVLHLHQLFNAETCPSYIHRLSRYIGEILYVRAISPL